MNQGNTLFKSCLRINLFVLMILFAVQGFGQKKSFEINFTPKEIGDPFARDAVTPQDMTERAKHYPYMQGEIVVAIELKKNKEAAMQEIRNYSWTQNFGNRNVEPISYLMTKELEPNRSVTLVHL